MMFALRIKEEVHDCLNVSCLLILKPFQIMPCKFITLNILNGEKSNYNTSFFFSDLVLFNAVINVVV